MNQLLMETGSLNLVERDIKQLSREITIIIERELFTTILGFPNVTIIITFIILFFLIRVYDWYARNNNVKAIEKTRTKIYRC